MGNLKMKESEDEKTIEELLRQLRQEKNWSYLNVIEELNKLGIVTNEKLIRKWEVGLEYPDLDTIYKLSEIYMVPSEDFIKAKGKSFEKGYNSIHMTFIKWFCYFTGVSIKIGYIVTYAFLYAALVGSFMFFISKCEEFLRVRGSM